ncbi:MAG: hypothetical protein R6V59_00980 [Dehalococcoidia bacterium]
MKEAGVIRFVKMSIFPGVKLLFFVRKATDSIVKVHTIRFVGLPFIFASRGGWRTDAERQIADDHQ